MIQGGESGAGARPFDLGSARALRDACCGAGVPYFLKQLGVAPLLDGKPLKLRDRHDGNWSEWPEDLRVRQVPTVRARGIRPEISRKALGGSMAA